MTMHILSQIDLEHKTAFCTVCGHTEIHVPETHAEAGSRIVCAQRHKELNRYRRMWAVLTPEERKLAQIERHILKEIDPESRRAVCVICGPTDINQFSVSGKTIYGCATYYRLRKRSKRLRDFLQPECKRDLLSEIYQQKKAVKGARLWSELREINLGNLSQFKRPKPRVSRLQEASDRKKKRLDENLRLVDDYKRTHGCKSCEARTLEPTKFKFFESHLPSDQAVQRLVHKLDPENLLKELEKRDLHCPKCHQSMLKEYNKRAQALRSAQALRNSLKSS